MKCALRHNAAAVIFAHNHPSGVLEPSQADELITQHLKEALALVDIRVLDHFIVGARAVLLVLRAGSVVSGLRRGEGSFGGPSLRFRMDLGGAVCASAQEHDRAAARADGSADPEDSRGARSGSWPGGRCAEP